MKSYRVRQETFIAQLHDGTFDAVNYEALRTQGSYLTQYTDQLTAAFLMEGREGYLVLGQRGTSQNMVFTIVAAIGSVLFAGAMLYYARSLLLPVQQMSRGARRVADGEYDIEDFNFARSDEIGMLADSFNHLKHQIARTIHALESEAQLEKSLRQQESEAARLRQLIEPEPLCAAAEPRSTRIFSSTRCRAWPIWPESSRRPSPVTWWCGWQTSSATRSTMTTAW